MNYTGTKRWWRLALVIALGVAATVTLAATGPAFSRGMITSLTKTIRTRTLGYQVNTPLQKDEAVYRWSVQVGSTVFSGEYIPYDEGTVFAEGLWHEGDAVEVRIEQHDLILRKRVGSDLKLYIQKRQTAAMVKAK